MFYLYQGKVFVGRATLPVSVNDPAVKLLTVIHPETNEYQFLEADNGQLDIDSLTYTLAVKNVRRYAVCNHLWVVQSISETLMQTEQIPVPYALNTRIQPGWIFDGETFSPPDVPVFLTSERICALRAIANKHAEMLTAATGGATSAERDTWAVKEAAARDIIAGGTGGGVLVPVAGETLEQLAHKILTKAAAYKQLVGIADQIKRTAEKAVESLTLTSTDDLMDLDSLLDNAKQQAMTALQQFAAS